MLDLDSCVCFRMVKKALTPKKVTVDLEDVLTPKKEKEDAYDAGQWTEGLSKGVYVHKVCQADPIFKLLFNNLGVLKTRSQAYCQVPCSWQEKAKQFEQKWYSFYPC